MVGRRSRFRFNKVTAVSTTGFSPGAIEFAKETDIEIREIVALSPDHFSNWLLIRSIEFQEYHYHLQEAFLIVDEKESISHIEALAKVLSVKAGNERILRSTQTGELWTVNGVVQSFLDRNKHVFTNCKPNHPEKVQKFTIKYPDDKSHFVVETEIGPVRIMEILFAAKISIIDTPAPIDLSAEYRRLDDGGVVSQVATFPLPSRNRNLSLEMHNINETGETHIVLRTLRMTDLPKKMDK